MNNEPPKSKSTERTRIVEYLKNNHKLTTLDAREKLGIMNPAQRISELIKKGAQIGKDYTIQTDSTGARHRVRVYIWLGENAAQADFFGGQFSDNINTKKSIEPLAVSVEALSDTTKCG